MHLQRAALAGLGVLGEWGRLGVLRGCASLPCRWLLTLGATGLVLMGMSKGRGFGGSSRLLHCSRCCFSPFRLFEESDAGRWWQGGGVPSAPCPGGGCGMASCRGVSVFLAALLQAPGPWGSHP